MSAFHNEAIPTGATRAERMAPFASSSAPRRVGVAPPPDREQAFAKAKRRSRARQTVAPCDSDWRPRRRRREDCGRFFQPFRDQTRLAEFRRPLGGRDQDRDGPTEARRIPERWAALCSDGRAGAAGHQTADCRTAAKVDGEIGMAGGEATHLVADAGVYDNVAEHMELSEMYGSRTAASPCYCEAPNSILSPAFMEAMTASKFKEVTVRRYSPIELGDQSRAGTDFRRSRPNQHCSAEPTKSLRVK